MPTFDPTKPATNSPIVAVDSRDHSKDVGNKIKSPLWHKQVLKERDERYKSGKESPVDWETAKKQLRNRRS